MPKLMTHSQRRVAVGHSVARVLGSRTCCAHARSQRPDQQPALVRDGSMKAAFGTARRHICPVPRGCCLRRQTLPSNGNPKRSVDAGMVNEQADSVQAAYFSIYHKAELACAARFLDPRV